MSEQRFSAFFSPLCAALVAVAAAAHPVSAHADDADKPTDVAGSRDHPVVKRYPASVITQFKVMEFDSFKLPLADTKGGRERATKAVEGKLHDATYMFPKGVSCTQIRRNYENAFKAAGMTLHAGTEPPWDDRGWSGDNLGWISAQGQSQGHGIAILVTCGENPEIAPGFGSEGVLIVVDQAAMEQKVEVDAAAMQKEIEANGRIALYGINCATGKADIGAESSKVLAQIGALLKAKPEWKLRVEGHTDNVGKSKDNLDLSKRRAAAVVAWLVKNQAVAAARLTSEGFGDSKPLAANDSDEGKAKNRRVELTKL